MSLEGKIFETAIQVHIDIVAGGNFCYVTFKKKLNFKFGGQVDLTWEVIKYKWPWPDLFLGKKYTGIYDKSFNEYNTVSCKLHHISKSNQLSITCQLIDNRQLLCSITESEENRNFYSSEIYELIENK